MSKEQQAQEQPQVAIPLPKAKKNLVQIGCIGLIKAIDHFDLSLNLAFSTYAVPMITGEIRRFLRDDGAVKVSRSLKEQAATITKSAGQKKFSQQSLGEIRVFWSCLP